MEEYISLTESKPNLRFVEEGCESLPSPGDWEAKESLSWDLEA